jgi:hypothetical protein
LSRFPALLFAVPSLEEQGKDQDHRLGISADPQVPGGLSDDLLWVWRMASGANWQRNALARESRKKGFAGPGPVSGFRQSVGEYLPIVSNGNEHGQRAVDATDELAHAAGMVDVERWCHLAERASRQSAAEPGGYVSTKLLTPPQP